MKAKKTKQDLELELARFLANLRESRGLSQEALGVQMGKGQSNIAKIEGGHKKVSVMEMLEWLAALELPFNVIENQLVELHGELSGGDSLWKKVEDE